MPGALNPVHRIKEEIMPVFDLAIICAYLAAVLWIGIRSRRSAGNSISFSTASGRLPMWAIGLSIFATFFSSISFIALPGKAFSSNWNPLVFSLSIPLAAWIAAKWFVPFYRASGEVSAYTHFEKRFGTWARVYAVVCYLLTQFGRTATILYLLALPLAPLTGLSIPALILIAGVFVIAYTLVGGVEAVVWADAIQSVIFTLGALFCLGTILAGFPEGPTQAFKIASADHKFLLGDFSLDLSHPTFWVALIYGLFVNLNNFGIDQNYVQRYASARTSRDATRSLWLGALLYPPVSIVFLMIGTALYSFYKIHATANVPSEPDKVLPFFMAGNLPPGLLGLLVAALFAAGQSTVASSINSSATVLLHDVFKRFIRPDADEPLSLRFLRMSSVGFGILGTAAALAMINVKSALDAWWTMQGIFSGGMLGLFLLSLANRRLKVARALTACSLGLLVLLWISLPNEFPALVPWLPKLPVHSFLAIVFATLVILLTGLLLPSSRTSDQTATT